MNLSNEAELPILTAKLCSVLASRKVAYAFLDNSDILFLDKKDIILNQILACEKLLKYATEKMDRTTIEKEIEELKSALDLIQ